jgi:hypothetical protein
MLYAQPGPPDGGDRRAHERIQNLRKVRLIEALELTEEQSARFIARLNEQDRVRREIQRQRADVYDRLDSVIRDGSEVKELEKVFAEVRGVNEKMIAQEQKFFDGLSDLLTIQQRGKLLLFESRFERELREALRSAARRRGQAKEGE